MTVRKPDAGQAFQAASFLLCVYLALRLTSGLQGTEFSEGWLTGPLLSMADSAIILFALALILTLLSPRIAAAIGIVSSLLCLPLYCFVIAPVPFAHTFAPGHELSVQPAPGFHWQTLTVTALFSVGVALCFCIRRLANNIRKPIADRA